MVKASVELLQLGNGICEGLQLCQLDVASVAVEVEVCACNQVKLIKPVLRLNRYYQCTVLLLEEPSGAFRFL